MDLSADSENFYQLIKDHDRKNRDDSSNIQDTLSILDLSNINLDNEESWLYESKTKSDVNYRDWLAGVCDSSNTLSQEFLPSKLKSTKTIDTRTFTRPKKKFIRPSISDYEQLYHSTSDGSEMNSSTEDKVSSKIPNTVNEEKEKELTQCANSKPLHFDLAQPTSLHNFDSFMINSAELESWNNMSPPSLMNSLCSSTFANLMESSFIKNDPVLREIRDKDFTETALLQDIEAPMFQSITESCSSLNSDTPENFLRKVSFNRSFRRYHEGDNSETLTKEPSFEKSQGSSSNNSTRSSVGHNATFEIKNIDNSQINNKNTTFPISSSPPYHQSTQELIATKTNQTFNNLNGTYRRTPKHNGTFRKSDLKNNRLSLNVTYEMQNTNVLDKEISKSIENDMNNSNKESSDDLNSSRSKSSTRTIILNSDSIENLKKRYSTSELNMDLNRLSYCLEENNQMNRTYKEDVSDELNRTVEMNKRSSLGSADSLDRMSSLSSSSKGSNKMLNMADIDAIVEMQEKSLNQVMSTPKLNSVKSKMWGNEFISPIIGDTKDHLSDSELSDEYKSVKTQVSSKITMDKYIKHPTKSLGYLQDNKNIKIKNQRSAYTMANPKPLQAFSSNIRGSYSNINNLQKVAVNIGGSQSNLYKPANNLIRPPSASNLKTMGTKLKGSYTSLRPISANLPVVPPVGSTMNSTLTITRPSTANVPRSVEISKSEVPPIPKEKVVPVPTESTFIKPQLHIPRTSGLPRPTGIPRPASRIPAPRSSNIR